MDPKTVETELRTNKIREGPIYRRTKFLQEWRERWLVLTKNYLLIFTNRNLKEMAEFIDLREVKTYKSYLKKDEDMIPAGFKLRTQEDMFYFCARNCNEKWTWLVSIERLMDFKYTGKSPYNNEDFIRSKGFMGQAEFQRGKFDQPEFQKPKQAEKPKEVEKPKQVANQASEAQLQNKLRLLEEEMGRLRVREEEIARKEREQEEMFLIQLNKLKRTEESLREIQLQVEEKAREADRILAEKQPREIIREVYIERPVEVIVEKQVEVIVEKQVEVIVEKQPQKDERKQEQGKQEEQKQQEQIELAPAPAISKRESALGKTIEEMKKFYESKGTGPVAPRSVPQLGKSKEEPKKDQKKNESSLHMCRDKVVVNLIQEFHPKAYSYPGLRVILQFLVNICADRSLGYQSLLIRQAKANENRFLFAEVLLQLINDYKKYTEFGSLVKLIEILIFQVPGIFKLNHFDLIKRKLVDLVYHVDEKHVDLPALMKTLYVVHKMKNLEKSAEFKQKLAALSEMVGSSQARIWVKKLLDDL